MKKSTILIIFLIILLAISFGIILKLNNQLNEQKNKTIVETSGKNDAQKFKEEYEKINGGKTSDNETYNELNINENNPMVYISLEELVDIINTENEAYIYISSSFCPYCRATVETLLNVAKDLKIDKIYYYDDTKQSQSDQYDNMLEKLEEKGVNFINKDGKRKWGVPLILKTKNGQVISETRGTSYQLNEGQSKYDSLTEDQKKQVYDRYYEALTVE
ncbi:MAG: hypothetical protein BHV99_01000 [Clostridium sp. 26_21]|nr:MAG: hypothetical protein BHV99_01000 [Clostridium sp. 26_21]